jgi:hypothetical protein
LELSDRPNSSYVDRTIHPTEEHVMRSIHPFRRTRTTQDLDLAAVGRTVAERGPAAARRPLAEVHRQARAVGVSHAVVDLLIDPTVPDVVRARALAHVSADLTRHPAGRGRRAA